MNYTETYYLIDFENVGDDGLSGIDKLNSHDHIHLFYTKNNPKIRMDTFATLTSPNTETEVIAYDVPSGGQSLDKHLVSYLGYLIGIHTKKNCQYVIISKDKGYDKIIAFWKKQKITCIIRQEAISTVKKQNSAKAVPEKPNKTGGVVKKTKPTKTTNSPKITKTTRIVKQPKSTKTPNRQKTTKTSKIKCELNHLVQQTIRDAGFVGSVCNKTASIAVKHYGKENFSNEVHNELRDTYQNYTDIYTILKPILKRYSSITTKQN